VTARFRDIKSFTRTPNYAPTISWRYLEGFLRSHTNPEEGLGDAAPLDLDPDFQRAHVWDDAKRARYVEFVLRGGSGSRDLRFNCAGWMQDFRGPYVIVDGKQRLEAVRRFMRNELALTLPELAGRSLFKSDFADEPRDMICYFNWCVNDLETREQVLQWYLEINSGGVVHTDTELARVRRLLAAEKKRAK
jgi:hypothetical protein